jgi:hypothetical protein
MKNLYTKHEFLNAREEVLNEGLGKIFKGLWNSAVKLANKVKGSKEIKAAFDKYQKLVLDTFNKMQNIETVKTATPAATGQQPAPATAATAPATAPTTGQQPAAKESYQLNEAEAATADPTKITSAEDQKKQQEQQQGEQNQQERSNLANLKPDQIRNLSEKTTKRIEQLEQQFDTDVNNIVARLTKNPNYSSDKLKQFAVVMKNQLKSYIYDNWYQFYTKIGDQKKILEVTKAKKTNDANFKKSIQDLNTALGEKQQEMQIKSGVQYKYYSDANKADINIKVVGKALGQDEKGNPDEEHKTMWKVMNPESNKSFWIAPNAFKAERPKFEPGQTFTYTNKDNKTSEVEIVSTEKDAKGNALNPGMISVKFPSNNVLAVDSKRLKKLK